MTYLPKKNRQTMERVLEIVSDTFEVEIGTLLGPRRWPYVAHARQAVHFVANQKLGISTTQVAEFFDCDHTTVIHACRAVVKRCEKDAEYGAKLQSVVAVVESMFNVVAA